MRLFLLILASCVVAQGQPLTAISTDFTGQTVYFATTLSQRGSSQTAASKLFQLRGGQLSLLEQSAVVFGPNQMTYRPSSIDSTGDVFAINRITFCTGGSSCFFRELASTSIQAPGEGPSFGANSVVAWNGHFAALFGNTSSNPTAAIGPGSVRLLDLQSGQVTLVGSQAALSGRIVADDGTILVSGGAVARLVRPKGVMDLTLSGSLNQANLSPDASRIVYDLNGQIFVYDVAAGFNMALGSGALPDLAQDGRTFSYLKNDSGTSQIWSGDAITGFTHAVSSEAEGIASQAISGDGTTIVAATSTGRLLRLDARSGAVTQLLGVPPSTSGLLTAPVPGSYNVLVGTFLKGLVPEVRIGTIDAKILNSTPDGIAIQIPWEVQPDPSTPIIFRSQEPAWEQDIRTGVLASLGIALQVGADSATGHAAYAIHQDWSAAVTDSNPALPGEIIHLYGTGYGSVDGTLTSGLPTPIDRLYRMNSNCTWYTLGVSGGPAGLADVLFAGLSPGLIGIYQFDFRIPADWPYPLYNAYCQFGPANFLPTAAIAVRASTH